MMQPETHGSLNRRVYDVTLSVESPFLSQGTSMAALGFDASQAVNSDGRAVIPGDQLKGILRQAFRDLANHAKGSGVTEPLINALFGRESSSSEAVNQPARGNLIFDDLTGPQIRHAGGGANHCNALTRIAVDDTTGAVRKGALQVVELIAPVGASVTFQGRLILYAPAAKLAAYEDMLRKALRMIPAVGAFKTVGFGRVEETDLKPVPEPTTPLRKSDLSAVVSARRATIKLKLDRPLVVDTERLGSNLFRSSRIIPGGALKGALAAKMERAGGSPEADLALSKLTIGHAFPVAAGETASFAEPLPQSLVLFPSEKGTGAGDERGVMVRDWLLRSDLPLDGRAVGSFQTDWKDEVWATVAAACGFAPPAELVYETRVRTAINDTTGTSKEGELFSLSALRTNDLEWHAEVDGSDLEASEFERLLHVLGSGLDDIGKTSASAVVTIEDAPLPEVKPVSGRGVEALWAVTLRTPALLNNPSHMTSDVEIATDYRRYWQAVSDGRLELVRHYGEQELMGGYLALRYPQKPNHYLPFLVTRPGSVFLLQGDGQDVLAAFLRQGLPPNPEIYENPDDWRRCPFIPRNGYGQIRLNAVDHRALAGEPAHV